MSDAKPKGGESAATSSPTSAGGAEPPPLPTSTFVTVTGSVKDRLYGVWICGRERTARILAELRAGQLEPKLVFVMVRLGVDASPIAESFTNADPAISPDDAVIIRSGVDEWFSARAEARASILGRVASGVRACLVRDASMTAITGWPVIVSDHLVIPAVLVRRNGLRELAESFEGDPGEHGRVGPSRVRPVSLVNQALHTLLRDISRAIRDAELGQFEMALSDPIEVLRSAARDLCRGLLTIPGRRAEDTYDACSVISQLPYEQRSCAGRVVFAVEHDARVQDRVRLRQAAPFTRAGARTIRKLLESTSDDSALLCDSAEVYGVGREQAVKDEGPLYRVSFFDRGAWSILYGDHVVMHVRDGVPALPLALFDNARFQVGIRHLQPDVLDADVARLTGLVRAASRERHGILMLICRSPEQVRARLGPQSMEVEPFVLDDARMSQLSRVDGALVLGVDGRCHAFGAILDGAAVVHEDRARGSRYNSAVRFVAANPGQVLAVVVSSDGMTDVLSSTGLPAASAS